MCDDRHQAAIAGQQARRNKGEARILHTAVGEARRQNKQIIAAPVIGTKHLFRQFQHGLRIRKFVHRCIEQFWFCVYAGLFAQRSEVEITDRNSE